MTPAPLHTCDAAAVDPEGRFYRCRRPWPHVGQKHFMRLTGLRVARRRWLPKGIVL